MMIKKRICIYMTCFALVFSYLLGGVFSKKDESHAGVVLDWTIGKVLDCTVNVVNGLYLETISQIADQSDNDTTKEIVQILTDADNLVLAGNLDKSSEKILKELDKLENQMDSMETSINNQLSIILKHNDDALIAATQTAMTRIQADYEQVRTAYRDYTEAGNAYAQAILDASNGKIEEAQVDNAKKTLKASKTDLEAEFNGSSSFENKVKDNLNDLALNACMYYPSYKTTGEGRSSNAKATTRYQGLVWQQAEAQQPFDHQKYESMTAAVNNSAQCFTMLLSGARIYYDYYTAKYEGDPKRQEDLEALSRWYVKMSNGVVNCLNDIGQQCKGPNADADYDTEGYANLPTDITTLMRPYDADTRKEIQYNRSGTHKFAAKPYGWSFTSDSYTYTTSAVDTAQDMDFYRVAVKGTPYLILKNPGVRGRWSCVCNCDATQIKDCEWSTYANVYLKGQDSYNLLGTKDGLYRMPDTYSDVVSITRTAPYNRAEGKLIKYLKSGGLENIPNADYVMTNDSRGFVLPIGFRLDTDMAYWCSTAIDSSSPGDARVELDYIDIYKSNDNPLVMLIGNEAKKESASVSVRLSDKERGSLSVTDDKGNPINGKVKAGSPLTLTLKVKEGCELRNLYFKPKQGDSQVIATKDSLSLMSQEKDGSYRFTYPMAYDDCTFWANFRNKEAGEGTEENPYRISSALELQDYMDKASNDSKYASASYKLTRDINFDEEGAYLGVRFGEWESFPFTGTFDGGGFKIIGGLSNTAEGSLFGKVGKGGVVKNIRRVVNCSQAGFESLLVKSNEGTITGCGIEGSNTLSHSSNYYGTIGLVALYNLGRIENCYNRVSVTAKTGPQWSGPAEIGGMYSMGGSGCEIRNCYNTGDLSSKNECYGISKYAENTFNFYNAGTITGTLSLGYKNEPVFYQEGTVREPQYEAIRMTEQQMKSDELLNRLNANALKYKGLNQWVIKKGENNGYPIFGAQPEWYALSTDVKGEGTLALTGETGDNVKEAPAKATVKVKAVPGDGRMVDNIKLYDEKGKTLQKFELNPAQDGSVEVSFAMPAQKVTVHAKFVKEKQQAAADKGSAQASPEKAVQAAFGPAKLVDQASGITVTGDQINAKAILKVTAYDETDPGHVELQDAASDDVLSAYDVSLALMDDKGKPLKSAEATFKGTVDVAFPVAKEDKEKELKVIHDTKKGLKFEDGGLKEDGLYHVEVSHLSPFAVVEYIEDQEANLSAGETIDFEEDGSGHIWIWALGCAAAALIALLVFLLRRRRKTK